MGLGRIRLSDLGLETFWAESPKRSKTWSGICLDEPSPDISLYAPSRNKKPLQNTCKGFYWVAVPFFSRSAGKRSQTGAQGIVPIGRELYHGEIRYAQRRPRLWQFLYIACNPLLLQRTFKRPAPTLQLSRMPRAHSFRKSPKSGVSQI